MAGFLPSCENLEEFKYKLLNQIDMTEPVPDYWKEVIPDIPPKMGTVKTKDKFDSGFFGKLSQIFSILLVSVFLSVSNTPQIRRLDLRKKKKLRKMFIFQHLLLA